MLKFTFSKLFENISIKVNVYRCRPENGRIPLIVQWYKMVYFMMRMIVLIIYIICKILLHHFVNTVHNCGFIAVDKERVWLTH